MKRYIDVKTGEVYGFELDGSQDEYVTEDMVVMNDSDYESYRNKPSEYHTFNPEAMVWKITKANQSKLDAEIEATAQAEAVAQVAQARTVVDGLIAPLQDAVDLEIETPEERVKLKRLKAHRVMLSRWQHPQPVPILQS